MNQVQCSFPSRVTFDMKDANHPRVSLLLITYNQDEYIGDAVRSVLNQNRLDFEFVICDDGSTDQTVTILEDELSRWDGSIPVKKHYSRVNGGLIANFNQGMAMCKGEYIIVMAGDDISLPGRVNACVEAFDEDPNCMLVVPSWRCIDGVGGSLGSRMLKSDRHSYLDVKPERSIHAGAPVCGAAAAYRRELFDFFGPLQSGAYGEDNCYWVRALLLGDIRTLSDELILWRRHSESLSSLLCKSAEEAPAALSCEKDSIEKYLRFLSKHEKIYKQWLADLNVAWRAGRVKIQVYKGLKRTCFFKCEVNRLKRYSLSSVPFSLWFKCMVRLLPYCINYKRMRLVCVRFLILRISSKMKMKYLSKKGVL